jgi:hypothetical protein
MVAATTWQVLQLPALAWIIRSPSWNLKLCKALHCIA